MTCRSRTSVGVTAIRKTARRPAFALVPAGIACFVVGVLAGSNGLGFLLIGLGAIATVIGVAFPFLSEVAVGLPTVSLNLAVTVDRREAAVHQGITPAIRSICQEFAELLTGDRATARDVVKVAVKHVSVEWVEGEPRDLLLHLLCEVVRQLMSPLFQQVTCTLEGPALGIFESMKDLTPLQRIVVVLHYQADLSPPEIGRIVSRWCTDAQAEIEAGRRLMVIRTP
jgi:hypothetical protein